MADGFDEIKVDNVADLGKHLEPGQLALVVIPESRNSVLCGPPKPYTADAYVLGVVGTDLKPKKVDSTLASFGEADRLGISHSTGGTLVDLFYKSLLIRDGKAAPNKRKGLAMGFTIADIEGAPITMLKAKDGAEISAHREIAHLRTHRFVQTSCMGGSVRDNVKEAVKQRGIYVGDKAIIEYLERRWSSSAISIINLLESLERPIPEELTIKARAEATAMITELYIANIKMAGTQRAFNSRLQTLRAAAERPGYIVEGGAITPVEDITPLMMGHSGELSEAQRSFRANVESVSAKEPWKYVDQIEIQPGLRLNVKEFIGGLLVKTHTTGRNAAPNTKAAVAT